MDSPKNTYAEELLAEPDKLAALPKHAVDELGDAIGHRARAIVNTDVLIMAVIDPATRAIVAAKSPHAIDATLFDWDAAQAFLQRGVAGFETAAADAAKPTFVYVPARDAMNWDLSEELHQALAKAPGTLLLAVAPSLTTNTPLQQACAAYSLTPLESKVVSETLRAGSIRKGADRAGVSYSTAREAVSGALSKVGAPRLAGLVHRLSLLALGVFPHANDTASLLADRWGLTARQARIALLLAEGLTREETARALSLSPATIKKQADIVFAAMSVSTAAELARMVSAATTLQALSEASQGQLVLTKQVAEPLRLIDRGDGSRIAVSDFGPRSGRPVLVTHACFSGRHPPRGLVSALMLAGYRPIAIDRPGYGLTDFKGAIGLTPTSEPFGAAAHDMAIVLDHFGLRQADVIGRGSGEAALAFAQLYPERFGRAVLIAPIPPLHLDVGWRGIFAAYRDVYLRNPGLIPYSIRLLSRLMDRKFVARMVRQSVASSAPDLRAAAKPGFDDDYYRTMQMYALGKHEGYIHEQTFLVRGQCDGYAPASATFHVIFGEHDGLMRPQSAYAYWRERLPEATFENLEGQGRLVDYLTPERVVAGLTKSG